MLSTRNMKNYEGYCSHLPSKLYLCAKCSLFGQSLRGDNHRTEAIYLQINDVSRMCIPPNISTNLVGSSVYCCTYISLDGDILKIIAR